MWDRRPRQSVRYCNSDLNFVVMVPSGSFLISLHITIWSFIISNRPTNRPTRRLASGIGVGERGGFIISDRLRRPLGRVLGRSRMMLDEEHRLLAGGRLSASHRFHSGVSYGHFAISMHHAGGAGEGEEVFALRPCQAARGRRSWRAMLNFERRRRRPAPVRSGRRAR
jgi:hypothetical protein